MKDDFVKNRRTAFRVALAACALLGSAGTAGAEEISIREAVAVAVESNLELAEARARLGTVEAARVSASAYPDPELVVAGEEARHDAPDYEVSVGLEQRIPLWGRRGKAAAVADSELARERHRVAALEHALRVEVRSVYRRTQILEERERLSRALAELNARLLRVARARFERGEVSELDVRQFEAEAAQRRQTAAALQGRRLAETTELRMLMGIGHERALQTRAAPRPELPGLAELLASASERPDLLAARSESEAAAGETRLRRAETWADPTLGVHYRRERAGAPGTSLTETDDFVGLSIRVPLPLGAKSRGAVQAARARERSGAAAERRLRARAETEVRGAYHRVAAQELALEEISAALHAAGKAERLAERAYGDGLLGAVQLVLAQQQRFAAENARLDALEAYYDALADLERAAGVTIAAEAGRP